MTEYITWHGFKVDVANVPVNRAGTYRFTNIIDSKIYNGATTDVSGRCANHPNGSRKFKNAVKEHGRNAFICEPTFYLIDDIINDEDRRLLNEVEADQIAITNSVANGYNIKAADKGAGPYGPEFSKALAIGWANSTPEQRAKRGWHTTWDRLTPEQRSERSKRNHAKQTAEERSERQLRGWETRRANIVAREISRNQQGD